MFRAAESASSPTNLWKWGVTDFELVDELSKIANVKVPQAIEDIRSAEVLHKTVCEVDEMPKVVKEFLKIGE